ncbi:MAG: hypothetical protein AB8G22_08640 [Saprospiraceae bacterium]
MMIRLLFISLILVYISACGNNCESEKVGEQLLGEPSKRFVPYADGETITLVGETGETIEFTNELIQSSSDRSCVKYRCELTADPFQQTPCEYFETESIRNLLRSSDDRIYVDMIASIFNYEEETELFYDRFAINASEIGTIGRGETVTHVHFTEPNFELNTVPLLDPLIAADEVVLQGRTFTNVLHSEVSENMVFFQPEVGLIGMNIAGDTLVVER